MALAEARESEIVCTYLFVAAGAVQTRESRDGGYLYRARRCFVLVGTCRQTEATRKTFVGCFMCAIALPRGASWYYGGCENHVTVVHNMPACRVRLIESWRFAMRAFTANADRVVHRARHPTPPRELNIYIYIER